MQLNYKKQGRHSNNFAVISNTDIFLVKARERETATKAKLDLVRCASVEAMRQMFGGGVLSTIATTTVM